ncbi:hypothetical protein ACI0FR_01220 [Paenochrobactrum sp. BZR 201-1]
MFSSIRILVINLHLFRSLTFKLLLEAARSHILSKLLIYFPLRRVGLEA